MKFGLAFASSAGTESDTALEICQIAEKVGFESVWGGEHVIFPSSIESKYPYTSDGKVPATKDTMIHDPLIWLAYVAAIAPTLRLGTCILILPQRNPLIAAKEIASLDRISGGRLDLGIGVGWLREEFDALGVPFEARGARTDEYLAALRVLWSESEAEFHGEFVDFDPVYCQPKPAQQPIPILVGGHSNRAAQRAGELGDVFFPAERPVETLISLHSLAKEFAEKAGRDPAKIELWTSSNGDSSHLDQLVEAGVSQVMVPARPPEQLAERYAQLIADYDLEDA